MTTPILGKPDGFSDPRVDALWRAASQEEPPAELDGAILAAARREVGAGPQSTGARPQSTDARQALAVRRRWWPLAAAATVAAIAVGALQLTTPDQLGAPASDRTVITDMPTPDKNLASEMAKIVPREDAAKDSATVDRTTPRQEAAKDSATVDRMPRRQEAAKNSAAVDLTTPRQKEAKDIAALDRTTPHANAPRSPTVAAAAPAPRKPVPSLSIAVPLAEPFPAAPVAPNAASSAAGNAASSAAGNAASLAAPNAASSAAGNAASSAAPNAASRAATRVASAPAAEKVAAPAPPTEAPRAPAVAQSAFAGRMTMKGEAGGSAIVLIEPGQPGGPPAAAQGVPQGTAARASPQVTMAKVPTRENLADAARTNEMARERDAERPVAKGRISDRAPLPVAEWIALIRRLRDEGKAADAARELAAFRAAHVDHGRLLPRDLVDWRPPAQ